MAKFKIDKVFKITKRGSVIAGDIIEGEIGSGDTIRLETDGKIAALKIKSVDFLLIKRDLEEVGLMVGLIDNDTMAILEKMAGATVLITTK
jgi:GTPase